MVSVFALILYYTKLTIFTTTNEMLQDILSGRTVDPQLIQQTAQNIDQVNITVLIGMVLFSIIVGIVAAHITLVPTRDEFIQRKKFITSIAHELRTPLAFLRTNNEVALYESDINPQHKQVLHDNIAEIKHITHILNNLVVFSRVDAAESLIFEPLNTTPLLESVLKKLTAFAIKHQVTVNLGRAYIPPIYANKTAIEQVFYNIIKNAIAYSKPEGGIVSITQAVKGADVVIVIEDEGVGMPQKDIKYIFEPFFRTDTASAQNSNGTGLGLSLVFEIIKIHKGVVRVASTEGIGTTFTIHLPLAHSSSDKTSKVGNENVVSYAFNK